MHVLIGPGCLGLGLIAPVTKACGFDIHLIGRPGHAGVAMFEYTLLGGPDETLHQVPVASFDCPPKAVVPHELREALGTAEVVLVTTTARAGIAERVEFVHALVDACAHDAEVVFVACENRLAPGHQQLLEQLPQRGVECLTTVVARVCRKDGEFTDDRPRRVIGHQHGSWMLETPTRATKLKAILERAPEVAFETAARVEAEHARERMLMNATQFALGLLAHAAGEVSMQAAANDRAILRVVRALLAEFYAVLGPDYDSAETRERGLEALQVLCTFKDDVPRVMHSLRRGSLLEFFAVFDELIAGPARLRASGAQSPAPFWALARALVEVLVGGESYADAPELSQGRVELSAEDDREAVNAFRAACTGWMPRTWVDAQTRRIARALRSQRARWSDDPVDAGLYDLMTTEGPRREAISMPEQRWPRAIPAGAGRDRPHAFSQKFDVCLSFAGEQRDYVDRIAAALTEHGLRVFYDQDKDIATAMWGRDLGETLDYVYREGSRFCLMFISADYAEKAWTRRERRSALARAIEEDEYVLPARFDDTELPGLSPTIGYIDLREIEPATLVDFVLRKLAGPG